MFEGTIWDTPPIVNIEEAIAGVEITLSRHQEESEPEATK